MSLVLSVIIAYETTGLFNVFLHRRVFKIADAIAEETKVPDIYLMKAKALLFIVYWLLWPFKVTISV